MASVLIDTFFGGKSGLGGRDFDDIVHVSCVLLVCICKPSISCFPLVLRRGRKTKEKRKGDGGGGGGIRA